MEGGIMKNTIIASVAAVLLCLLAMESFADPGGRFGERRTGKGIYKVREAQEILLDALHQCSARRREGGEGLRPHRELRHFDCFRTKVNQAIDQLEEFLIEREDEYREPIKRPRKCSDLKDERERFACNKKRWHSVICTSAGYYGKYGADGGCNYYGCWYAGGGCNYYGCWYAGGSCNYYGCIISAPKTEQACMEL